MMPDFLGEIGFLAGTFSPFLNKLITSASLVHSLRYSVNRSYTPAPAYPDGEYLHWSTQVMHEVDNPQSFVYNNTL
jgi:hypothetical protein